MRVPFKHQDVRRDAVEEEAVVRDDEHGPGEAQDRLLQRAQRADVQVVRGLVENEDLCWQRPVRRYLTKDADRTLPPSRTTDASCARFRSPPDRSLIFLLCSCLLYTSPSPRDRTRYRMPSSA